MASWLSRQREEGVPAACPVCRRELCAEDAASYIDRLSSPLSPPSTPSLASQTRAPCPGLVGSGVGEVEVGLG